MIVWGANAAGGRQDPGCGGQGARLFFGAGGGAALGFTFEEIVAVVVTLVPKDFYSSMTTHADRRIWQDVYRPKTAAGDVYLKLTVIDDVLIVSRPEL